MIDAAGLGALPLVLLALLLGSLFVGGDEGDSGDGVLGDQDSADGGPDNDVAELTDGPDVYSGNDGNDLIDGLGGNDSLEGNRGDDAIDGGAGDDEIDGGSGNDFIVDNDGDNTVSGGDGSDVIFVDNGASTVFGGPGNDAISSGAGATVVNGGDGDDRIVLRDAEARAFGDAGDDIMNDESGGAFLSGGDGADAVGGLGGRYAGDAGDDLLASYGESSADDEDAPTTALVGGDGDDQMWATGQGTTQMTGGDGADEMIASQNAFVFDFTPGEDTLEMVLTFDGDQPDENVPTADQYEVTLTEFTNEEDAPVTVVTVSPVSDDANPVNNPDVKVLLRGVSVDDISADDIAITLIEQSELESTVDTALS